MTYEYSAPERLERDWREGRRTPPGEMLEELSGDVDNIAAMAQRGAPVVPVQGRVSDYKSWLAAALASELADRGVSVAAFGPQRANRESLVDKLRLFDADVVEHASRLDLCIWQDWKDTAGRVDRSTCESIGCPYWVDNEDDLRGRAADGLGRHRMVNGGSLELTAGAWREMGSSAQADACPAELYRSSRSSDALSGAVDVATYAKAFADAALAADDPLGSDVLLLDEAHTVAADTDVVVWKVEPEKTLSAATGLVEYLDGVPQRWAEKASRELGTLVSDLEEWFRRSSEASVSPDGLFAGSTASLGDSFSALGTADSRVLQAMKRVMSGGDRSRMPELGAARTRARTLTEFLSRVKSWRDGDADFVHHRYEEGGETVNEMEFRRVSDDPPEAGTTPHEVYRAWRSEGTHPAIERRWGPLLDRHIEAVWNNHAVSASSGAPGVPVMPVERLREIAGADTVVTLSATHNELSDPTRGDAPRPTRHRLVTAPVFLRSDGRETTAYDGKDGVDPETPWFASLFREAAEASGDSLAAVPINTANLNKWASLPVRTIEVDGEEVQGVVPNSRGSIGEKSLESLDVDTVVCGVQVQAPAPTARRLVRWWDLLAPRREDPEAVLEECWKLLAQHAVSGTIQAGGRFDWNATNLVFERPDLIRLAGFECEEATPGHPGFAGALASAFERESGRWADERDALRAAKTSRYLERSERKTPSPKQMVSEYRRVYDATEDDARRAVRLAVEAGRLAVRDTERGARFVKPDEDDE